MSSPADLMGGAATPRSLESTLYGPDGKFLYKGRKLGLCAACKTGDYTYDVGAMGPSFRFCKRCIRESGARALRQESNRALQNMKSEAETRRAELKSMSQRYAERFGKSLDLGGLARANELRKKP